MYARARIASTLFFAALLGSGFPAFAAPASRWSADRRLTFHPGDSQTTFNFARDVAAGPDGSVHVIWYDDVDGVSQIYTRRSLDGGITWGPETRLSRLEAPSEHPALALSGRRVYAIWHDFVHGRPEVVLRRSADNGATWSDEVRLGEGAHTSVAASGSRVRAVWGGGQEGQAEVYTRGSEDGGATWGEESRISATPFDSWVPTVELAGDRVYVAFVDYGDANEEEYFRRSLDGGRTWGPDVRLSRAPGPSLRPSIAVSGREVHVVWCDGRSGEAQVYAKQSTDGGTTWGPDERLTRAPGNPVGDSMHPAVAAAGGGVYVVWTDRRDGNAEIYFKRRVRPRAAAVP